MGKLVKTQHVLVTVKSDGRYPDEQLATIVAQRMWSLEGVETHGVNTQFVASTGADVKLIVEVKQ